MTSEGQGQKAKSQEVSETAYLLDEKVEGRVPDGHATGLQLTLNIVTCGLGTGIFTLPWSTAGASCLVSVVVVAVVLVLNAWTISILVNAAERYQVFDIGSLVSFLPGRLGQAAPHAVNGAIWLGTFLCLVSYVIVIADCASPFLEQRLKGEGLHEKLTALASLLVLPLCFLDQRSLAITSTLSMAAVSVILGLMITIFASKKAAEQTPRICVAGFSWGSVAMFSAMMQTVIIQMCVLPMYGEMKNRSPGRFRRVIYGSFAILFLMCASFALLGYLTFGEPVSSNVLLNLPHSLAGNLGRLCAGASVVGVYPIILKPMIAPLQPPGTGSSPGSLTTRLFICGIVASVMVTACFFRDLGKLNVINGAMSMGIFVAVVPFMVGTNLVGGARQQMSWTAAMYALLVLGVVSSVLGLCMVDNYAADLRAACVWVGGDWTGHEKQ